jgi:lysozyme
LVTAEIGQPQYDALVSFSYNLGALAYGNSNLLRTVIANPVNPKIEKQFMRWVYSRGKALPRLTLMRIIEAWLYYNGVLNFSLPL